jgi:hypothetical protein
MGKADLTGAILAATVKLISDTYCSDLNSYARDAGSVFEY